MRFNLTSRNFSEKALGDIERRIRRQQERKELEFLGRIRDKSSLDSLKRGRIFSEESKEQEEELKSFVEELEKLSVEQEGSQRADTDAILGNIKTLIADLFEDEQKLREQFVDMEMDLSLKNQELFATIQQLIASLQAQVVLEYRDQTRYAYNLTSNVSTVLALLVFLGVIGSLGFVYTILKEIRRANKYRNTLESAKERSDELARAKQDFLANMSHEIRNPLHAIQGYQSMLVQEPTLRPENREQVEMIGFASGMLMDIVNDILDFSKLEAGKLRLEEEPFDPSRLFLQIKHTYRLRADEKGLAYAWKLDLPEGQWLIGDELRISQIVSNLLSNAVKFTSEGEVRVEVLYREGNLELEVRDSGMGMPEAKLAALFDEFSQADTSISRKYGGTGLGLAIVKRLVDLQGGTIQVSSAEGVGTQVQIVLPLPVCPAPVQAQEASQEVVSLKGHRILLVDDDASGLKLLRMLLTRRGAEVVAFPGGQALSQNLPEETFSMAFLDIQMPEVNGLEARELLASAAERRGEPLYPVIAMTANVFAEEQHKLLASGFDALLLKPFKERALMEMIQRYVGQGETPAPEAKGGAASPDVPAPARAVSEEEGAEGSARAKEQDGAAEEQQRDVQELDLQTLRDFCMGDEEMLAETLADFSEVTASDRERLAEAFQAKAYGKVREIAHQLASRFRQVDFYFGEEAKALELSLKAGATEEEDARIAALLRACSEFQETVDRYREALI
ncbi:histidine kinase [Nitritalea halalkaliphila LW7]|uniref:histidine kinase n=1 Tax=Nitritalea halalkaliphila LW7 TaxID=1189621 RepID=I5BSQ0_9BACT|nr:ATP-binding protein [Nitritalea halalkaliphila]EIM72602.1 histidine kinase [Nitritalea halalkaliphila LW7]